MIINITKGHCVFPLYIKKEDALFNKTNPKTNIEPHVVFAIMSHPLLFYQQRR